MNPDMVIFWLVVWGRFVIPLFIPRYPLPAILAALVLDGVDQTVFQQFTSLPLEGYQSYDKALDIYYLVIAYLSTMRNWTHLFAFRVSRFLIYYRLIGVVLFELSQLRALLLIFPNTFEYFFIFYESLALRWNPKLFANRFFLMAAALIWIVIKLPQEYWIHVAQLDATEFLNVHLLGEPAEAPIVHSFLRHPEVLVPLVTVVVGIVLGGWWVVIRLLPKASYRLSLRASDHVDDSARVTHARVIERYQQMGYAAVAEKMLLLWLVGIIFGQMLPNTQMSLGELGLGVLVLVGVNTWLGRQLQHLRDWSYSIVRTFVVMSGVNGLIAAGYGWLMAEATPPQWRVILFFGLLYTLLVTLYDRYRPIFSARFYESA